MKVVYLVVSAAPPALQVGTLIDALQDNGWDVCLAATPTAAGWLDLDALTRQTGNPVRHDLQSVEWPHADVIVAVPATFNTINKWAAGISDSFALGILNESIGLRIRTIVCPYAKATLAAHPAFDRSLRSLESWGVEVLPNECIRTGWNPVLTALDR
ncbi:flavoprotein [Actinokineospora xionganensis]|uniref:Flavoprotein n=1 Tax=Actinokineospora xionganensis TaxID=2684470 RepID=A0ABR7L8S2_9PSEU|nr:flavoprotein [Actinokineospora xionganensis]MBC6448791.1 flavoprotein [Actinokineospora xionganensis]